jgi:L-rhamnose mutarotase
MYRCTVHMTTEGDMIRKAFVMSVNAGAEAEYERRHFLIWPELKQVLKNHGVLSYSIFLLPQTRQLFAYLEVENEAKWAAIANTPECRRWWQHMTDLMPHNLDGSPTASNLKQVFHLSYEQAGVCHGEEAAPSPSSPHSSGCSV